MACGTTSRFARAESPEELLVHNGTGYQAGILDEFKPYVHQRWNEGCANAARLFEEIIASGYRRQPNLVRTYLHSFRAAAHITASPPKPPEVCRITGWIMTDPARLEPNDRCSLGAILAASPELDCLVGHVVRSQRS